jgi:hypothetical protein
LTTKEYAKVMFAGLYKKPAFILSTLLGLYYATTVILNYFKVIDGMTKHQFLKLPVEYFFFWQQREEYIYRSDKDY